MLEQIAPPVSSGEAATAPAGATDGLRVGVKRKRSRAGCLNCGEEKPACQNCLRSHDNCKWPSGVAFRQVDPRALITKRRPPPGAPSARQEPPLDPGTSPTSASKANSHASPTQSLHGLHGSDGLASSSPSTATSRGFGTRPVAPNEAMQLDEDGLPISPSDPMKVNNLLNPSPEGLREDGIFIAGSEYRELHELLRMGIFSEAGMDDLELEFPSTTSSRPRDPDRAEVPRDDRDKEEPVLTPHQEFVLWQNYVIEISSWVDKFDLHKHYRNVFPSMAKDHPCLRYAILALSARHLERKDGTFPASTSLALYQEAIHQLLPVLHERSVAVIASCVTLCVLEMFSCSPKAWRRHLDGCANLFQAVGIRGDSSGVEGALFWVFARMDVCGGLISSIPTLVPIDNWTANATFEEDVDMFLSSSLFEDHANYACYLLARVLHFFGQYPSSGVHSSSADYQREWCRLFARIEEWYAKRPEPMKAVLALPADASQASSNPFPTLLFSNGAAISGNQLYHSAALLMISKKPKQIHAKHVGVFAATTSKIGLVADSMQKSVLFHARQIVAITITNPHHGCWTNCIQPMWIAGRAMSHPSEHRAILSVFERIEKETGWGAAWRAHDLQQYWGDQDPEV